MIFEKIRMDEFIALGIISVMLKNAAFPGDVFSTEGFDFKPQMGVLLMEYAIIAIIMVAMCILYGGLKTSNKK